MINNPSPAFRCCEQLWLTAWLACQTHCVIHLGSAAQTAVNKHSYCPDSKQAEVTWGWHCYLGGDAGCALQTAVFLAVLMKSYPDRFQTLWTESNEMTVRAIGMYYLHVLLVFVPGAQSNVPGAQSNVLRYCSSAELYIQNTIPDEITPEALRQGRERERWKPQWFVPLCKQFRFSFPTVQPMGVRRNIARLWNLLG